MRLISGEAIHTYNIMSIVWLCIGLMIFTSMALWFYHRQNTKGTLGGPISRPKTFWLFWAMFYYFFLSAWIFFILPACHLTYLLKLFIMTMVLRAIIQPIMLYVTKSWTPFYGISFNLIVGLGVSLCLVHYFYTGMGRSASDWVFITYLTGVALALFTDSYYAYVFHRIVGEGTKGNHAVWYASPHNPGFNRINKITTYLNFIFFIVLLFLLFQIFLI